jgi:hypothetical protein
MVPSILKADLLLNTQLLSGAFNATSEQEGTK